MKKQLTAVFDFDGVIAEKTDSFEFDVFGKPIQTTIDVMKLLKSKGWKIVIFTCRQATPKLEQYLKDNNVPYDELNRNSDNPPDTSNKPISDVIIDDKAINPVGASKEEMLKLITEILQSE